MNKLTKQKEQRRVKKAENTEEKFHNEEIPAKDKNGIDIIPKKTILENSDKTLTTKTNALS